MHIRCRQLYEHISELVRIHLIESGKGRQHVRRIQILGFVILPIFNLYMKRALQTTAIITKNICFLVISIYYYHTLFAPKMLY